MRIETAMKHQGPFEKYRSISAYLLVSCLFTLLLACGNNNSIEENAESNIKEDKEVEEVHELPYLETLEMGECGPELGCFRGFISHGMELVIRPDDSSLSLIKNVSTNPSKPIKFRDAQDFGDRFDTAFLKPLVKEDELELYDFKIFPTVTRDNFAEGFELYTEGLSAKDKSLTMGGEGNFILGDVIPYDKVDFRAIKIFRIEMSKFDDEAGTTKTNVICMEISTTIRDNMVEADKPVNLGGLSDFHFYYTEDSSYCSGVDSPNRVEDQVSTLPATVPEIP